MEPIDKASALQRLLASELTVRGRQSAPNRKQKGGATGRTAADLRKRVVAQLSAIDPEWPDAEQKSLEVYVRATLSEEFGAAVAADPTFGGLVADVVEAIRQHPQYDKLAAYLRQQLQQAHRKS